jgi:hypothetical protein
MGTPTYIVYSRTCEVINIMLNNVHMCILYVETLQSTRPVRKTLGIQ